MVRFLRDLGVDPTSRMALILAWKLKAERQCEFSQKEFRDGMIAIRFNFNFNKKLYIYFFKVLIAQKN
jgi:hypothetical protein